MKTNPTRALAIAAGLVIVALTAAAFWLSYAHLAEVALAHGMEGKEIRAWAWPATLDLFIVAGELLMLRAALARRVDVWAIGLTVVGSGSSIALNVAGVGANAELLDYVVAAVPPTAALLAFGALMRQIHQALAGQVEATEPVTGNRSDMTTVEPDFVDVIHEVPPAPVVIPAVPALEAGTFWDATKGSDLYTKLTASVPAEQPREVVTEVIALSPSELRRKARALNRQAVRSTSRPVTIKTLQDELGLSRREATELRREVVTGVTS
ncbi:DUF2637 domain-containing protein [Streptomyces gossypiisoli]|uniref:DUF2637 domain-containing protein n=1 Tax=Streptomyces gossypiisoli TaxID=2748864 RepID=UPI0015DB087B|nr:DUF2637 domain-containing protein [Streptomyces gossypiisoli]